MEKMPVTTSAYLKLHSDEASDAPSPCQPFAHTIHYWCMKIDPRAAYDIPYREAIRAYARTSHHTIAMLSDGNAYVFAKHRAGEDFSPTEAE